MTLPEYFRCYTESFRIIRRLTDEQAGKLYKAKYEYMVDRTDPIFDDPALDIIWDYERSKMDRDFKGLYIARVDGIYGQYCKKTPAQERLSEYDWVLWKKNNPLKEENPDPLFDMVEPEDFIRKGKQKADPYDEVPPFIA